MPQYLFGFHKISIWIVFIFFALERWPWNNLLFIVFMLRLIGLKIAMNNGRQSIGKDFFEKKKRKVFEEAIAYIFLQSDLINTIGTKTNDFFTVHFASCKTLIKFATNFEFKTNPHAKLDTSLVICVWISTIWQVNKNHHH